MNGHRTMRSKDRVLCTVSLQEPDRVPVGFSSNPWTLLRLKAALGVTDHADLLDALGVDIVDLRGVVDPVYCGPVPWTRTRSGGITENIWGMRTRICQTATGPEQMYCDFPLRHVSDPDALSGYPWPSVDWFDFSDFARRLEPWRDRAIMASGASVWQHPGFLRGFDELMVDIATGNPVGSYLMDRFTDFYVAYFDRMFSAAPGAVDILRIADDLGMQDRLLLGPAAIRQHLIPRIARLVDMAHAHGVKVMFHSCGSIRPVIGDLLDIGVDVLDPVQVTARDMDPAGLKRDFGGRVCFHGGIDTQYLLPQGSPGQVAHQVHRMVEILGRGGGYIVAPGHVLQTDVPLDNIRAMYRAATGAGTPGPGIGAKR